MPTSEIIQDFEKYVAAIIDERGIYPYPCYTLDREGKLGIHALAVNDSEQVLQHVTKLRMECCKEIIFGIDMTTRPDQGTEFADVLVCGYWKYGARKWEVGVINYQHDPRIVRPFDWDNEFWKGTLGAWLKPYTTILISMEKKEEHA